VAGLNYKLDISLNPSKGSPGTSVELTAKLSDATADIKDVYVSVPEGNIWEKLSKRGEGTYAASAVVPQDAPPGTYQVWVYAVDEDGERGPQVSAAFTVTY